MLNLSTAAPVAFIMTRDRAVAEAFYGEVLGLPRGRQDDYALVFVLAGAVLRVTEVRDFEPGPYPVLGWIVSDIAQAMRALIDKGIAPKIYDGFGQDYLGIWTAPDGSAKVSWFADHDGNVLSLTEG